MLKNLPITLTKLFCVCSIIFSAGYLQAQSDPMKFGKIELKELQMAKYEKDTSASALILCDFGQSYFRYTHQGFQIYFDRHIRIKILKKSGYSWADAAIPYFKVNNTSEEEIVNLKGYTYNLDGDKIVKDKLTKEAIFEEKATDNWHLQKFTMPNVKEGSVIEFSYTIKSDFHYNFREWEFQHTIPVLWSEYRATFPEYFNYKQLSQGYEPFHISEKKGVSETFTVKYEADSRTGMNGGRSSAGVQTFNSNSTVYRWVTKDVPAMREEAYMTTVNDYVTKIEFELASTHYPGDHIRSYSNSWSSLTEMLLKHENFGLQLNKTGFVKNELSVITAKFTEPEQKIIAIYEFARKTVKWNGIKTKYAESTTKKAFENRTGNAADINLMLVAMLREAGLDANPVILSTRDHGRIMESYALLNKFNYVIAHVNLNGKDYLLDATDPVIGYGILPARCLNGIGWLVNEKSARWISLQTNEKFAQVFSAKFNLDKEGELKGTIQVSNGGYSAVSMRKTLLTEGKDKYMETVKKEHPSWQISSHEFTDVEDVNKTLNAKYDVAISDFVNVAGDMIYVKPMLSEATEENPFKLENRKFPVDFSAPMDQTYICAITIPQGYKAEELPKGAIVDLPEKSGRFSYMVAVNGNIIQLTTRLSLKKPVFYAEEYAFLKEFYNQIVSKHAEQIVLKKITN